MNNPTFKHEWHAPDSGARREEEQRRPDMSPRADVGGPTQPAPPGRPTQPPPGSHGPSAPQGPAGPGGPYSPSSPSRVDGPHGAESPSHSGVAVAALVVGGISFLLPVVGGVIAVILGIIALAQIFSSHGAKVGTWMATTGLVLGLLTAAAWLALITSDAFQEGFQEGYRDAYCERVREGGLQEEELTAGLTPVTAAGSARSGDCWSS